MYNVLKDCDILLCIDEGSCVADEGSLKKLDSSVKRNTALIKKIRQVNEDTKEGLLDDIRRTNQSKVSSQGAPANVGQSPEHLWSRLH